MTNSETGITPAGRAKRGEDRPLGNTISRPKKSWWQRFPRGDVRCRNGPVVGPPRMEPSLVFVLPNGILQTVPLGAEGATEVSVGRADEFEQ